MSGETKHCRTRNQQRCLPPVVHHWLTEFGEEQYDGHGGVRIYFSHRSIRSMERVLGRHFVRQNQKYLNAYRIEGSRDGGLITSGWRTNRLNKSK